MAPRPGLEPTNTAVSGRARRLATRTRNPKWQVAPLRIDMALCINCDACLRACPPQFGAIFNDGPDVVVIPELCSGCDKCLPACPIPDCIVPDPGWSAAPEAWWALTGGPDDPYV